jgi:hypothetical protein
MNQKDAKILLNQVAQVATNLKNPKLQKAKNKSSKQLQNVKIAVVAKSPALPVSRKSPVMQDPIQGHPQDLQPKILTKAATHLQNQVNLSKVRQRLRTKNLNGKRITMKTPISQTVSKITEVDIDHMEIVGVEGAIDSLKIVKEVISTSGTTTEAREETSEAETMTEEVQTIGLTTMIGKEALTAAGKEAETSTTTETTRIETREITTVTITTTAETTTIQETTKTTKTKRKMACYSLTVRRASTTKTWTIDHCKIYL